MAILRGFFVFFIFLLISLVITAPLGAHMGTHLPSPPKDGLLISWILSWEIHSRGGESFWDANIFYPSAKALTYTEHFLGFLPFALLLMRLTGNMVAVLNTLTLVSLALSGLGMYLLFEYLSKNRPAAFVAAIAFAFAPYKMNHLIHLHILAMHWIPFILLFWHKSIREKDWRNYFFFSFFTILEGLSCLQYCLFILFLLPVITLIALIKEKKIDAGIDRWRWLASFCVIFLSFVPVFLPYYVTLKKLGLITTTFPSWSASILSFLIPPERSWLWGWLSRIVGRGQDVETWLFPGLIITLLAFIAIKSYFPGPAKIAGYGPEKDTGSPYHPGGLRQRSGKRALPRFFEVLMGITFVLVMSVAITGGFTGNLGPFAISVTTVAIPSTFFLFFFLLRILLDKTLLSRIYIGLNAMPCESLIYLIFIFAGIFFSFYGPFVVLGRIIPTFASIQVSARFFSIALLGLSLFAGWGYMRIAKGRGIGYLVLITILMLGESFCAPVPLAEVNSHIVALRKGNERLPIPGVYGEIARMPPDTVILELPLTEDEDNATYMYYSTFHWKKLVNGYSGINPRYFRCINETLEGLSYENALSQLATFKIDYLLIHRDRLSPPNLKTIDEKIASCHPLHLIYRGESIDLYKVAERRSDRGLPVTSYAIDRRDWVIKAHPNPGFMEDARNLKDGIRRSYWTSGRPARQGDGISVDMLREYVINGINFFQGTDFAFYLRSFKVETSTDGAHWEVAASRSHQPPPFETYFLDPGNPCIYVPFTPRRARFLRITSSSDGNYKWTFHELKIYSPDPASGKKETHLAQTPNRL